jgi:hypothetical protein
VCYDVSRALVSPASDCSPADAAVRRVRDLSRLIVVDDLHEQLRARLGTAIR